MNPAKEHLFEPDRPLDDPADDKLGREPFAHDLAEHIGSWTGEESIVIGINGDWGAGKSTVKNFIRFYLGKRSPAPTIVEFNPWEWSGQGKLLEGFFSQIGIALGQRDKSKECRDLAKKWKRFSNAIKLAATFGDAARHIAKGVCLASLPAIGFSIARDSTAFLFLFLVLATLSAFVAFVPGFLDRIVQWFSSEAVFHEKSLNELREELRGALGKLNSPVVVFLDDVDRLTDEEIKILFQLVKANCQFPNLVYIILFEREIVERALSKIVSQEGPRYLRKIIQHTFDLPEPSPSRVRKLISDELNRMLFESGIKGVRFESERWQRDFADTFFNWFPTLRDAKRFFGSFKFVLLRHSSNGALEVDPIDLLVIEGLRTMHYDVFRRIARGFHSQGGFESFIWGDDEMATAFAEQADVIAEAFSSDPQKRESILKILIGLFPQASKRTRYGEGTEDQWLRNKRVCHRKHFRKYFQLALDDGDVSAVTLDRIIAKSGDRKELATIFAGAKQDGRILDLLEALWVVRDQIPQENLPAFVTAIFDIGDDLPDDADAFLLTDCETTCIRIIYHRLKDEPVHITEATLRSAYSETSGIVLPVRFFALEDEESRSKRESGHHFLISDDSLPELKSMAVSLIKARSNTSLLDLRRCSAVLYRWRDWEGAAIVREWSSDVIKVPMNAATLLVRLLSVTYVDSRIKEYWLNGKSVEELVDLEELLSSVQKFDTSSMGEEVVQAVKLLELAVKRRSAGENYEEVRLGKDRW